jgi:hypothetical protein
MKPSIRVKSSAPGTPAHGAPDSRHYYAAGAVKGSLYKSFHCMVEGAAGPAGRIARARREPSHPWAFLLKSDALITLFFHKLFGFLTDS